MMPPQHAVNDDDLYSELAAHNAYFDSLVNLIPHRLYVAGASGDGAYDPKYKKGQHKESKEARKARNKAARNAKFAPEGETTLQAKKRIAREQEEESSDGENEMSDVEMSDGDGEEDDAGPSKANDGPSDGNRASEPTYASRIEALRAKLRAKMAAKRAQSGTADAAAVDTSAPALTSKRAARRAEKKRRQEAAKQRNKKRATSTAETKKEQKRVINLGGSRFNEPAGKAATSSAADDLATIDYQSLAGLKPKNEKGLADNKSMSGKKKSLETLLADAERKQARLKELKASHDDADREKAQNIEWGEALKSAGGKDAHKKTDPKLLKKGIKRRAKKKAASAKAWGARVDTAREATDKKQRIRTHNLSQRKLGGAAGANLSGKRIKEAEGEDGEKEGKKRRRMGPHAGEGRAGFEGKRGGFINGEGSGSKGGGGKKGKQ
ncbi:hypothetical protein ACHAXT_005588 [Thalassiosira profunda]